MAGAAGVLLAGGTLAGFVVAGGDEPTGRRADFAVSASPPAWTVRAADRLTSGTGLRYDGTMTIGGRTVRVNLRLTPSGMATGALTAGALRADVVAVDGDTYIKAGPAFWRSYVPDVPKIEYYAGRWSKAPASLPGFDVPDVLGPASIARMLEKAPASPPRENVNGVPAFKVTARGAEYLMAAEPPHRLLSVRAGGPNAPALTAAPVAAPATLFAELRSRVAGLGGAADPRLRFRPGALRFGACDKNPNGCTVTVPATLTAPAGSVPEGARAALRATISSRGARLGSCTASEPVPEGRSLTLRCTVVDRDWRDWIRHALDNPGSYPYEATAHVVGEAVARDAVPGLLARVDRERDTVMNRAVDEQPPQVATSGSPATP